MEIGWSGVELSCRGSIYDDRLFFSEDLCLCPKPGIIYCYPSSSDLSDIGQESVGEGDIGSTISDSGDIMTRREK
jgi:hypothetical protein